MKRNNVLYVYYDERLVGTLAQTKEKRIAFEYAEEWIQNGFSISPLSLPLKKEVYIPTKTHFSGLHGVFADSLPDAWGNLLVNRVLKKHGIDPGALTPLDRLAIVGDSGMGALSYRPKLGFDTDESVADLDLMAQECKKILNSEHTDELDHLYRLGGTSGGARPKVMMHIKDKHWIIKFPAHVDFPESGLMEYRYSLCAKQCGIIMPETKLFHSDECSGYFGIERFDRNGNNRIHMLTAAAILELDFREPSLDYHSLMKLTNILTKGNKEEIEQMFARMCFNVYAHNRDDHSKNFSFLYDERTDEWHLSPAYDLTYSNTYYGEHTTSVNGNGKNPSEMDLLQVGTRAGLGKKYCVDKITEIRETVHSMLADYFV